MSCLLAMGVLILGLTLGMTCKKKNQPPGVPSIPSGPTSGRKGDTLRFSTVAGGVQGTRGVQGTHYLSRIHFGELSGHRQFGLRHLGGEEERDPG